MRQNLEQKLTWLAYISRYPWRLFARHFPKISAWIATWGWSGLVLAAIALEEAHEYGIAFGFIVLSAISLVFSVIHWGGIPDSLALTRVCRVAGMSMAVLLVFLVGLWIYGQKSDQPWSRFPGYFDKAFQIHGPINLLSFNAYSVGMGNMPDRKNAKTYDGNPWNESLYGDVRFSIDNPHSFPLQNLDLTISVIESDANHAIAGYGQLSGISGVEFHVPPLPEITIRLRGANGKVYNVPMGFPELTARLSRNFRVFCPRLEPGESLSLIIATMSAVDPKSPPDHLRITGSYETLPFGEERNSREKVDKVVSVDIP